MDEPFPAKPKGMRWKTYERLQMREMRLQNAWAVGIMGKFKMFGRNEA